jgi:hypothetical protein
MAKRKKQKAKKKLKRAPVRRRKVKRAKKPAQKLAPTRARLRSRGKPVQVRVSKTKGGTGWVLEKVFVPRDKFQKNAMVSKTGKRSTFVSKKPRKDVWIIIGCLPKDYDKKAGRCKRTTIHKEIKQISSAKARKLAANPQLMVISNPLNPCPSRYPSREVKLAEKAYNRFHFRGPATQCEQTVPTGWPKVYVVIGECERFDVQTVNGKKVSRRYTGSGKPILATTSRMRNLYIFSGRKLNIPAGKAFRVDYKVPKHSGRTKWSRRWYHPHETHPKVSPHKSGKAVQVAGSGLSVTPRGIEG